MRRGLTRALGLFAFLATSLLSTTLLSTTLRAETSFDYGPYNTILSENLRVVGESTQVNYKQLKEKPSDLLRFTKSLSSVSKDTYQSWSKNEKIAFLINAYNAFTLQLIVENYPVKSIKDIGSFFSSPWKKEFFSLLGKKAHLDHVEHGILREDFKEARIHFAVNCASIGCPPLKTEAFLPETLDQQLTEASIHFINSPSFNRYDKDSNTLYLSSIFKWYGKDFGSEKEMRDFIAEHLKTDEKSKAKIRSNAEIDYLDYDWNLNEMKEMKDL